MKKLLTTLLTVTALAVGGLTLTAFRHHPDPARAERFVTHRVEDLLDDVKATDAQRQQILAIKDKLLADGKALHAAHANVRQQLLALWQADSPDAGQVHQLVNDRTDAMKAFANEIADATLQIHGILTPEQRAIVTRKLQRRFDE